MKIEKIDAKLLEGLKYRGAKPNVEEKDGRKVTKNIPFERPLKPEDVIGMKETEEGIVIVTSDGRKYTLKNKIEKK